MIKVGIRKDSSELLYIFDDYKRMTVKEAAEKLKGLYHLATLYRYHAKAASKRKLANKIEGERLK